jgi:ribose transport system substrate-binding protein
MRKLIRYALAAAISLGGTATTAYAQEAKETYGMVVFLKGSEFFNWCFAGFKDAAESVGAVAELQGPADWDASAESRAVDQLVAKKVKGIAVTAGDADTLLSSINAAMKAGVATLTFDSDSPKSKRLLFVGTDHYNAGFAAGVKMGELLGNKAKIGFSGIPGLDAINARREGFIAGLKSVAPEAEIVAEVNDEGDLQKAETVITAMLQANPQINGIFTLHGNPATGAVAAARNVGRDSGPDKVQIIAYAIDLPILQMVDSDELSGPVAQNPYLMGVMAFHMLYAAAHPTQFDNMNNPGFGNVPTANLDTGVRILTKGDPAIKAFMSPPSL